MSGESEAETFGVAVPLSQRALGARPALYLDDLNPAQRAAVEALDGPVLMLAGAGTGKTKALMARVAHLITTHRATPRDILAVTFTNKAAREMKDRLNDTPFELGVHLFGSKENWPGLPWMGTFHALSLKILRRHAELVELKPNFTILDTDDQLRLIRQILELEGVDRKRWTERWFLGHIEFYKNRAWVPEKVPVSEDKEVWLAPGSERVSVQIDRDGAKRTVVDVYGLYQKRLKTLNAVDFGDLILYCVEIFKNFPDVLEQYQRRFRYILVDEYQDTNVAQYLWLRLLAQGHRNICCVGDDDQSIYGWRGAEVGNILRFEKDFPGAVVVRLEQNYRSTPHILAAASGVIARNEGRLGKTLWTAATAGEKLRLIGHWDGEEEARWIGEEIEALQRGRGRLAPKSLEDMAILVRASHQMRAFEDRFLTIGLPYRVIGGPRFYERAEVRDAMAYFRLAVSPDDDLAFERVVNLPKRGLGDKAQAEIRRAAQGAESNLLGGARALLARGGIGGKGAAQLRIFCEALGRWHDQVQDPGHNHIALAEMILDESGYTEMWQNDKSPDAAGRLENLKELVKALEQFENLQGFLEHVALIMENDSEEATEKVSIMTLHAAKGLEFPAVFLPGWEEGLFPSQRSMDESGQKGLEEERRLAYVGITRAEELCTISFASNRRVYGQWQSQIPSRFIDELPADHVDVLTPPGLYGGGFGAAAPVGFGSALEERAQRADVYNSPGWQRLQSRSQFSQPREVHVAAGGDGTALLPGERVFHQKFGYGEVIAVEGDKLDVEFDHAGSKKIVARWVVPAHQVGEVPF